MRLCDGWHANFLLAAEYARYHRVHDGFRVAARIFTDVHIWSVCNA